MTAQENPPNNHPLEGWTMGKEEMSESEFSLSAKISEMITATLLKTASGKGLGLGINVVSHDFDATEEELVIKESDVLGVTTVGDNMGSAYTYMPPETITERDKLFAQLCGK